MTNHPILLIIPALMLAGCAKHHHERDPSDDVLERERPCDPRGVTRVDMDRVKELHRGSMGLAYEIMYSADKCHSPSVDVNGANDALVAQECAQAHPDSGACRVRCMVTNTDRLAIERATQAVETIARIGELSRAHPECVPDAQESGTYLTCLGFSADNPVTRATSLTTRRDHTEHRALVSTSTWITLHGGLSIQIDGRWEDMGCGTGVGWSQHLLD